MSVYNHRPMVPTNQTRLLELLEAVKVEYDQLSQEAQITKSQRDEYEHKGRATDALMTMRKALNSCLKNASHSQQPDSGNERFPADIAGFGANAANAKEAVTCFFLVYQVQVYSNGSVGTKRKFLDCDNNWIKCSTMGISSLILNNRNHHHQLLLHWLLLHWQMSPILALLPPSQAEASHHHRRAAAADPNRHYLLLPHHLPPLRP